MAAVSGLSKITPDLRKFSYTIFTTLLTKGVSLTVNGYKITASTHAGSPTHLTIGAIEVGLVNVLSGTTGEFVSGDVTVTVTKA